MVSDVQEEERAHDAHERHDGLSLCTALMEGDADACPAVVTYCRLRTGCIGAGPSADPELVEEQDHGGNRYHVGHGRFDVDVGRGFEA